MTPADLEPRKNLRSSKAKGKGKNGKNNGGSEEFNFPAPSSPAKDSGKRKGRPDDSDENKKRKRTGSESDNEGSGDCAGDDGDQSDDMADRVPPKREPKPPQTYSYKMLECPRKECSKQYKHTEGLRWHLSHSHPEFIDGNGDIKDAATVEREEQERRRRARLLKEERRQKENRSTGDSSASSGDKPPSKSAKLDLDKACGSPKSSSKPGTPTSSKPGTPHLPSAPVSLPSAPLAAKLAPASTQPLVSSRLPGQLPAGLIAPKAGTVKASEVTPLLEDLKKLPETPRLPPLDPEKPPANSPAYSDISDDGEPDTAPKALCVPPPVGAKLPPKTPSLTPFGLPSAPDPLVSGLPTSLPLVRPGSVPPPPDLRASTPSSLPSPRPGAPAFSSPSVGPSPGTPEYHKYLAANGFPPFPYPYPVGMDPNYHVQLLKTDLVYKAKWEKDRAERERAFKEELDKDQGRYSGLSLLKDDHNKTGGSLPSTPVRPHSQTSSRVPEDLRKREPSGDRGKTAPSPVISVKAEFREREEAVKKEAVKSEEGVKPTMETRGPPPGPQTFGYMHPGMVRPPYSLAGLPPPFDPILSSSLAPFGLPGAGPNPYLSSIRPPGAFSFPGDPMGLRSPFPSLPSPEDLMRSGAGMPGAPPGLSGTKALDLLQQHASQYYANQKLAELQERALKSPSQSPAFSASSISSHSASPSVSKAITTMAGKESPTPVSSASSDKSKSPPPLRHVHTHTHTHIGLGYPLLPPVPGAVAPLPGGLPPGALPPPSVGVVPASFTAGKFKTFLIVYSLNSFDYYSQPRFI